MVIILFLNNFNPDYNEINKTVNNGRYLLLLEVVILIAVLGYVNISSNTTQKHQLQRK